MSDWKDCSDEELLLRLRAGEEQIEEYLLEKYKPCVKSKSRVLFLVGGDREDLIQEGMIGLFKAMRDYDPEKNVPFAAFADICVDRQLKTAITKAGRLKNAPLNAYISLSEENGKLMDSGIEEIVIERASFRENYQLLQKNLSPMEKEVLEHYLEGRDYTEIAEILGKTDKSIDNALQRIKAKVKKLSDS